MFLNVYLGIAILIALHVTDLACYVNYEIFHGFDYNPTSTTNTITTSDRKQGSGATSTRTSVVPTKSVEVAENITAPLPTTTTTTLTFPTITYPKFLCPEEEQPFNIGAYEVPTQRDVALQIQRTLVKMFRAYQRRAMGLLHDIQEATKATTDVEKKCYTRIHYHENLYKKCVKQVSKKCELITKNIVSSLERQRADVSAFIDGTICSVHEMKTDPLQLIKVFAMELASIKFALPGFLRLLGSCSSVCDQWTPKKIPIKKPLRHMTDQDLVVKHFLTKKSYIQLIKGSK